MKKRDPKYEYHRNLDECKVKMGTIIKKTDLKCFFSYQQG